MNINNEYQFDTVLIKKNNGTVLEEIFYQYDHWEKYDQNKEYTRKNFNRRYKNEFRTYKYILCFLEEPNGEQNYYILYERVMKYHDILSDYCSCVKCEGNVLNPFKYLRCAFCTGCLKLGENFSDKIKIDIAKKRKEGCFWINKVLISELMFIFILILIFYFTYILYFGNKL